MAKCRKKSGEIFAIIITEPEKELDMTGMEIKNCRKRHTEV